MQEKIKYLKSLPKKRIGAGVLLFNRRGELLVLKPGYKGHWTIPGGVAEEYESPAAAARREAKEETGLNIKIVRCLAIDFVKFRVGGYLSESLQLVFLGEKLSDKKIKSIKINEKEIVDFKFVKLKHALKILSPRLAKRIKGLNNNFNQFVSMEDGMPVT